MTITLLLSSALLPCYAESAKSAKSAKKAANTVLADGVYNIKNAKTGLYIDSYDLIYDANGSSYLDEKNGGSAQDIYVKRLDDGSYLLYPQSENAEYALSVKGGTEAGSTLSKSKEAGKTEKFVIYAAGNGSYNISPANQSGDPVTFGVSEELSKYRHNYVSLCDYTGKSDQMWVFEEVKTSGLSLAFGVTKVKLYSVGKLYATLTPYNYGTHNIKWTSSDENILMIDGGGNYCALAKGSVTVTAECEGMTAECTVVVSESKAFSWFSQHSVANSDWNAEALADIYFTSGGLRKRFMIDKYGKGRDWMDEGCYLTSIAMVLSNLGATMTKGYDFRSGQSGDLPADPYTVALANSGNTGPVSSKAVLSGNPILVSRSNIESRFTVAGHKITSEISYGVSPKDIKEALDEHPEGVIVYFSMARKNRSHYIVFTKCLNPDAKNSSDYRFEVCDSASYDAERGDHIPFESCISYTSEGYRLSYAVSMLTYSLAD